MTPNAFDGYEPNDYPHLGEDGDQSGTHAGWRHKDNISTASPNPESRTVKRGNYEDRHPQDRNESVPVWRSIDSRKMYRGMITADPKVRDAWIEGEIEFETLYTRPQESGTGLREALADEIDLGPYNQAFHRALQKFPDEQSFKALHFFWNEAFARQPQSSDHLPPTMDPSETISPQFAAELGRQVDELEAENASLRAAEAREKEITRLATIAECAEIAEAWEKPSFALMRGGEMTAQELRTVIAVAASIGRSIRALSTTLNSGAAWECMGRKQSLPEPGECSWPDCGCDDHATKVIEALLEQGWGPKDLALPRAVDGGAREVLAAIQKIVHTPTKDTMFRGAYQHFQSDFDAIRKLCASALPRSEGGAL